MIRRTIRGRERWYCQLVQEGVAPQVRPVGDDVVGYDIGPSTIAYFSEKEASLEKLCLEVEQPWKEMRRIQRAMDRSRRATNPDNYDSEGRVKRGAKRWVQSGRYRNRARKLAETERRLAAACKTSHGALANQILALGKTIKGEDLCYKRWQKNFGRSVKVRAPGMLVERIRRKAESAGGGWIGIDTRKTRLSQFDHTTGKHARKPLSQRTHFFGDDVIEPVQRDLYNAFLARCCGKDFLDMVEVRRTWPGAEPLLRRAMSRMKEPARWKGTARPHVLKSVRAGRPSKRNGRSDEAVDTVAQARAMGRFSACMPTAA
ncbi:MAG: hypothetical protein AB7T14_04830 [Candidatus Methylacidiphilaceae bacterium]